MTSKVSVDFGYEHANIANIFAAQGRRALKIR